MLLKFPHIRLFMRNMLAEGVSCADTIAHTAYEYGLISKEAVERVTSAPAIGDCPCMVAARQVLVENFASSAKAEKLKSQVEGVWATIESRLGKIISTSVANGRINSSCAREHPELHSNHSRYESDGKDHRCELSAPAVFDILLQELSRY